jgi:Tfp pilus assembly protein PilF
MTDNPDNSIEKIVEEYKKKLQDLKGNSYEHPTNNFWLAFIAQFFRARCFRKIFKGKYFRGNPKIIERKTPEYFQFIDTIMNVLYVRDQLDRLLVERDHIATDTLDEIINLDQQLKEQENRITTTVDLAEWREILKPKTQGWWWFLVHPWDQRDRLWGFCTLVCLAAFLTFVADIVPRFWAGGPSTFGAAAIIGSSMLSLILGGEALTQVLRGQEILERVLKNFKVHKYFYQETMTFIALILALTIWRIHSSSLPRIAIYFREQGCKEYYQNKECNQSEEYYQNKGYKPINVAKAESDFKRALAFNPDDEETYFFLGLLYEDLQNYELARTQYQIAAMGGKNEAYNNLARLYILDQKYIAAAGVLQQLRSRKIDENNVNLKYALYKNLGWLELKLGQFERAKVDLQRAIKIADDKAPAHCLLAMVIEELEKQTKSKEALVEWESCKEHNEAALPEDFIWLNIALERVDAQQ